MSQTISLKLSDFDAALLSELSKREAKTPEELILEALHSLFASRLDDKIIPLSSDVFDACSKIIFEPEKDKEVLMRRHKLMDTKPVSCEESALATSLTSELQEYQIFQTLFQPINCPAKKRRTSFFKNFSGSSLLWKPPLLICVQI